MKNLIDEPGAASALTQLRAELERLMTETGLTPANDRMPIDAGIKSALPDQKIR